jgi:cytochrome b6-f complex iron-sulfur subunit
VGLSPYLDNLRSTNPIGGSSCRNLGGGQPGTAQNDLAGDAVMAITSHDVTRRGFLLLQTLKGAFGVTLLVILYPVAWFLRPRKATTSGALEVVAPFKLNELATTPSNPFNFGGKPCLVVMTPEGAQRLAAGQSPGSDDVRAFNAVCTHVDCTVKYRAATSDIFCSCHEGTYDLNGHNVAGPPPRPLEAYRVTLRGEKGQEEIVVSRQT